MSKTFEISVTGVDQSIIELAIESPVSTVADNVTQAQQIAEEIKTIFSADNNKHFYILVDVSKLGLSGNYPSPQARSIYMDLLKSEQISKIAFIAPTLLLKSIIRFIAGGSIAEKMTTVNSRQEGIDWLSNENN
jgi:hypothetical protein